MRVLRRIGENLAALIRTLRRPSRIPPGHRTPLWPVKGWIAVAASLAILFVAVAGSMLWADAFLIGRARALPDWVHDVFEWITWFGDAEWFLWPAGMLLLIVTASPWRKLPRFSQAVFAAIVVRIGFIFLALGVPVLLTQIIKRLVGRARPYVSEVANPYAYDPLIWDASYASLPSGHATNAFALAIAIGALWPKARLPMWIFAIVIAMSRVVVSVHFPSDIIAGAFVGVVGALLVRGWFASRRLGFTVGDEGIIHCLPGPSWRRAKEVARRLWAP